MSYDKMDMDDETCRGNAPYCEDCPKYDRCNDEPIEGLEEAVVDALKQGWFSGVDENGDYSED